jgi:hypothetical protein
MSHFNTNRNIISNKHILLDNAKMWSRTTWEFDTRTLSRLAQAITFLTYILDGSDSNLASASSLRYSGSVGIATSYGLDDRGVGVRVPVG